jgi:hypothetical protein
LLTSLVRVAEAGTILAGMMMGVLGVLAVIFLSPFLIAQMYIVLFTQLEIPSLFSSLLTLLNYFHSMYTTG